LRTPELHCTQRLSAVKQHLMERLPQGASCWRCWWPSR